MEAPETLIGKRYGELSSIGSVVDLPAPRPDEDRSYVGLPSMGLQLVLDETGVISAVFLFNGEEGYATYDGPMPGGIAFTMDRAEVRASLGSPERAEEPKSIPILGPQPAWDRFDYNGLKLACDYSADLDGIVQITIMDKAP